MPSSLELRAPTLADEEQVRRAADELEPDGFNFLSGLDQPWEAVLHSLEQERQGVDLASGRVPTTYLLAVVDGDVVGRASIRHELTEKLLELGGHIGYAVRPAFRRRGYATRILRMSLEVLRGLNVDRALVTCDEDNVGSARVITTCGGVLEDVRQGGPGQAAKRRYWIDLRRQD